MSSTVSRALPAPELPKRADQFATASLEPHPPAQTVRDVAAETVRKLYPKQEAAAIDLGMDRSRLNHKLRDGSLTLAHLEQFGPAYVAEFAAALVKRAGEDDPKARVRQLLRAGHRLLEELAEELK